MDRLKLEHLTAHSNALAAALVNIQDSNDHARQRCLNFSAEIRGFVKAWSNLSKALHDPQLEPRPAFTKIVERLLTDNLRIINDLRTQLAEVRNKQEAYDAAIRNRRWVPGRHKTAHLLVAFLGRETTVLRLQQVIYAVSVLDVILGVILHAKSLGSDTTTQQDAHATVRDQVARLKAESDAKALVYREEVQRGDKLIVSSLWLSTVMWHNDAAQQAPFETLALQWFRIVPEEEREEQQQNEPADMRRVTRMMMQMQHDLREQAHKHQDQISSHQERHEKWKTWAEANIRQLEFTQEKTKQEANAKIEGLTNQLEVQQQKIEQDAVTIEQLEFARKSWAAHYQKQSEKLQQLETSMKGLQKHCTTQQAKLDNLQQKYEKLLHQNQALRNRLEQSEVERDALAEKYYKLQTRHSEVVRDNKQWVAYYNANKDRDSQIKRLRDEMEEARKEITHLKHDLTDAETVSHQLRSSLNVAERDADKERHRADRYKQRLSDASTPKRECPNSFENRQQPRSSHSRARRSDGSTVSVNDTASTTGTSRSRATSRDGRSRASSSTYVDGDDSDREYYESRANRPRRSSSKGSTGGRAGLEAWFSPVQRARAPAMA